MIKNLTILRVHGKEFRQRYSLSSNQYKAFSAILNCRTSSLGAHIDSCDHCEQQRISYNSCRNRHCPKCQTVAKEQWLDKQEQSLLDIGYFHVVFTVPDTLNFLFFSNQRTMYDLLFKAASETLLELAGDSKYLGAQIGVTTVLHTWGQNLLLHPHLHCVVTGGGLTKLGAWRPSRMKFFLPVKVLSMKFRGKFLAFLRRANLFFDKQHEDLAIPSSFDLFISELYTKPWVTYCKPPFDNASKVLHYLGRYTHRVAISNNRIRGLDNGKVSFLWRDYKDGNRNKLMTISAIEFLRRFMLHVLPPGFRKIRHYGLLAARGKFARVKLCRRLTRTASPVLAKRSPLQILSDIFGSDFNLCPNCGIGHFCRASP